MGATNPIVVTSCAELQTQLDSRADEVFGNPGKAQSWLNRRRKIFDDRSPEQIIASGDVEKMRDVLRALIAIEFGTFS